MKVYFLDYGWLEGDINWMVALKCYATKSKKAPLFTWEKFPEYGVLIEQEGKRFLYDTGSHPDDCDRSERFPFYYKRGQGIVEQLALIGLKPTDIHAVVLSHIHDDHIGNIGLFAHADIYISRAEYEMALAYREEKRACRDLAAMKHMMLVEHDIFIASDLELKCLPGHSCGLLGLYIHAGSEPWFFVSDAVNTRDNYNDPPKAAVGLYDEKLYFETLKRIKSIEKEKHAHIFFGHDREQFEKLNKCPAYYLL